MPEPTYDELKQFIFAYLKGDDENIADNTCTCTLCTRARELVAHLKPKDDPCPTK